MTAPSPLDEHPIHQAPLSMSRVTSSDKNFYDRCYLNAHDPSGEHFLVAGLGIYPNLRVRDGFVSLRRGDAQHTLRASEAVDQRELAQVAGPIRLEVVEPLQQLRLVCDDERMRADLTWRGSFPATMETRHTLLGGGVRPLLDAQRFCQVGTWEGVIEVDGQTIEVDPSTWAGARDRSWGIRPSGDDDPAGRNADEPGEGFWWLYSPLRFDDFMVVVIVQEQPDGYRSLNDAIRVWPDGRVEQLGWPRFDFDYRSGTRHPERCRIHLTAGDGSALEVEVETLTLMALHVGCGYPGDPDWKHGQWKGRSWVDFAQYDYAIKEIQDRVPWGGVDHVARAVCRSSDGIAEGRGLLEHMSFGRHDPTGFKDWMDMAP